MSERFARSEILYGENSSRKFSEAKVAVCGVGAVGSFAVESLARIGVGNFLLVDFDTVEISNINRQLCALTSTLGKKKTEVVRDRILDINPNANVEILDIFIDEFSLEKIFATNPDVVVDAIDSITSKCALLLECSKRSIAVVSSMGAARRKNMAAIKIGDLFDSKGCPLAARVRKFLRAAGVKKGAVGCVYSDEQCEDYTHIASADGVSKKIVASSPIVTGAFGLALADLAVKQILARD